MAEETIQLRVRYPGGQSILGNLTSGSKLIDLKLEVAKLGSKKPGEVVLRIGYPPTAVTASDETSLSELGVSSGDQVIAEFQESEESKEQKQAQAQKAQQQKPNTNPISQPQKQPISLDSANKGGNPQQNVQPQGNQGTNKPSETNYMNDLALSQEEYDAQLARALADSMQEEKGGQIKPSDQDMQDENLFDFQNTTKIPDIQPISISNKVDLGPQKSGSNFDDDEYARKLQEELYAENIPNVEQPRQQNADRFDLPGPAGYYGNQNNQAPFLGQNFPSNTNPFGGFGGYNNPLGGGFGASNDIEQDEELERVLQESLKQSKPVSNTNESEYDEDLKQVLEMSKKEK